MSSFGDELKRLRETKGLSQRALGDLVGLTQGAIGHVETGRRQGVGADVLYKLCDALGVSCEHFRPFLADAIDATAGQAPAKKPAKGRRK
jgi:transcriptional regulator with XRE-family HTH domain